jgi:hypothetical protein
MTFKVTETQFRGFLSMMRSSPRGVGTSCGTPLIRHCQLVHPDLAWRPLRDESGPAADQGRAEATCSMPVISLQV